MEKPSWCSIMPARGRRGRLRRWAPAGGLRGQTHPVLAAREIMPGDQLLPKMLRREIKIPGVEQLRNLYHYVHQYPRRDGFGKTSNEDLHHVLIEKYLAGVWQQNYDHHRH